MSDWYEKAEHELTQQLNNCEITDHEFELAMRDLTAELRDSAEQAASDAYQDVMDNFQ